MVPLAWTGPDGSSHTAVVTLAAAGTGTELTWNDALTREISAFTQLFLAN